MGPGHTGSAMTPPRLVAAIAAIVLTLAAAGTGFYAAYHHPGAGYYYGASSDSSDDSGSSDYTTPTTLTESDAYSTASAAMSALESGSYVDTCDGGSLPTLDMDNYTIGQVTPQTSGSFAVTAQVELNDGSNEDVSYVVDSDSSGSGCVEASSFTQQTATAANDPSSASPTVTEPSDVPAVATRHEPVPSDAALPERPASDDVVSFHDAGITPTTADQLVEYQPVGLDQAQADAVRAVIGFMTQINRQDFQAAWQLSTYRLSGAHDTPMFELGWRTSRYYQAAFGEPEELGDGLIIVPSRWVSRQDGATQHADVPSCTYWPQYMFVLAHRDGRWMVDISGKYTDNALVLPHERYSSTGELRPNPINQRVTC